MESVAEKSIDKSMYLKAFNQQFVEMLDDIERVIPDNLDIVTMKKALLKLKRANPKLILTMWHKWVAVQYGDKVSDGDYEFFVNKDYKLDLSTSKHQSSILESIERMRETVRELDSENKKIALEYVKNLCELSKIYMSN